MRTKCEQCEDEGSGERHILGWSPGALWYENDTAVPVRQDWTGLDNTLRNVSLSRSLHFFLHLSLVSSPIVFCPGKTFAIYTLRIYQSM